MSYVSLSLGALERRNPLPVGRYSYTSIESAALTTSTRGPFIEWLNAHRAEVKVRATATTTSDDDTMDHYVFDVVTAVTWPATTLGFPNIEPKDADPGQVLHKEAGGDGEEFWWDKLTDELENNPGAAVGSLAMLAVLGLAGYYILKNLPEMMEKRKAAA